MTASISVEYILQLAKSYSSFVDKEWTLSSQFEKAEERAAIFAQNSIQMASVQQNRSKAGEANYKPKLSQQIALARQAIKNEIESINKNFEVDNSAVSLLTTLKEQMSSISEDILGLTHNMDSLEKRINSLECSSSPNITQSTVDVISSSNEVNSPEGCLNSMI